MARRRRARVDREPFTIRIESLSHEGRGVAHTEEGKTVFVDGALPDELVTAHYSRKRGRFDEAVCEQVLEPSSLRVEPPCPHFGTCGGCSLQHLDHDEQVRHKDAVLLEQLRHVGGTEPETVLPPLTGPQLGYRRKARLGAKLVLKKGGVLVGFREKGKPYITDMYTCPVLHPMVGSRISELRELIGNLQARDRIPQIEVAIDDDLGMLIFRHLDPLCEADTDCLRQYGERTNMAIYLQPAGPDSIHPLHPAEGVQLHYRLPDFDLDFHFRGDDFTQVNTDINRAMVSRAVDKLDLEPTDRVLDLFCGLGNFTLPVARTAGQVSGVEGDAALVQRAEHNARLNGIDNARFEACNLMENPIRADFMQGGFNKLLLDPPRSGAIEVLEQLDLSQIERIVYVSCNPATLARDSGYLVSNHGFTLLEAGIMDMFPHTAHVESMAVFTRGR